MYRRAILLSALATPFVSRAALSASETISINDLYAYGTLSDFGKSLLGQRISVNGYMAPPLKADAKFFVLTRYPLAVCPFCDSAASWPPTVLAVFTQRAIDVVPYTAALDVRGVLEYGEQRDEETGFVSMLRLENAVYG